MVSDTGWKRSRGCPRTTWTERLNMDLDCIGATMQQANQTTVLLDNSATRQQLNKKTRPRCYQTTVQQHNICSKKRLTQITDYYPNNDYYYSQTIILIIVIIIRHGRVAEWSSALACGFRSDGRRFKSQPRLRS